MSCSRDPLHGIPSAIVFFCTAACVLAAEPQRLTHDGSRKLAPVFADKGNAVLFSMHNEPNAVSLMRLQLPDGRLERVDATLTAHQWDADISADGRYLCFALTSTSPQTVLVVRDLQAKTESRFAPKDPRGTVRGPRISPDHTQVVFTLSDPGGQQIASVDMQGGHLRRLTESAGTNAWPALSPDGRQIAFASSRNGHFQICVMQADGSQVRQLTDRDRRNIRPAWSPDGTRLAFTSADDGNLEIYVMQADGTGLRRVTDHPDRDDFPIWHPDGRRLLVVSEREGDSDLYLIPVDP